MRFHSFEIIRNLYSEIEEFFRSMWVELGKLRVTIVIGIEEFFRSRWVELGKLRVTIVMITL